jgi:hypothetical protein
MDISRQVLGRSMRMGWIYIVLSQIMGIPITVVLSIGAAQSYITFGGSLTTLNLGALLALLIVPIGAVVGLVITTPIFVLFVNDKNAGVLEYLLAVGMDQRSVFMGYLKASLMLSLIAIVPVLLVNTAFMAGEPGLALLITALTFVTGISNVALVTVLMTAWSSVQRKPSGMTSSLGMFVGIVVLMPEFFLLVVLGNSLLWLEGVVALSLLVVVVLLLLSLDRLIRREKFLP